MIKEMKELSKKQAKTAELLPCGRFRARDIPVGHDYLLHKIYESVGVLCLSCFREGDCSFKLRCEHMTNDNLQIKAEPGW